MPFESTLERIVSRLTEVSIDSGDAKATITINDYSALALATVTVTIDVTAHVLTEGTDWNRGTSNAEAATSLAAAINALAGVSASASAAVVTITAPKNITSLAVSDAVNMTLVDSSLTTIFDPSKDWELSKWKDAIVEVEVDDVYHYRTVSDNTKDTLTIATLPAGHPVAAGAHYNIRMALRLADIDKWGGTTLTGRDISLDLAKLGLQRWGRDLEPEWVHAAEVTAPAEGAALVTKAVGAGKSGYIYGFLISAQETNDFKLNWISGETAYSIRIPFGGAGSTECVDPTPLNEGLPADTGTDITITNINAATAGKIYQARLLYAEV